MSSLERVSEYRGFGLERVSEYRGFGLERVSEYRGFGLERVHCIRRNNLSRSVLQLLLTTQCTIFSQCANFTIQHSSLKKVKVKLLEGLALFGIHKTFDHTCTPHTQREGEKTHYVCT